MTTYKTIFTGEVRPQAFRRPPTGDPLTREPPSRPLGPGRQPGFFPPPDRPRRPPLYPRPPGGPNRRRQPFNPSRPSRPPLVPPGRPVVPTTPLQPRLPGGRPIPGWARRIGRASPYWRAYDLYRFLREIGQVGFTGGEPWWKHHPDVVGANGCPGIPEEALGASNGCYGGTHPGQLNYRPYDGNTRLYSMWGQKENRAGNLRWYPARVYRLTDGLPGPVPLPVLQPGVAPMPDVVPSFPPRPDWKTRRDINKKRPPRPKPPDDPVETKPGRPDRKMKAPPWLMRAFAAAMAVTEAVDAINAFWDVLPDAMKAKTGRSGIVSPSGLNPGMRYPTAWDKAKAILDNWGSIHPALIAAGMTNIMINQYMDNIYAAVFGGVDEARRRAGGTGWGFGFG